MNLNDPIVELIPKTAFILNLRKIRGVDDWLPSIEPSRAGIYAWFRSYEYNVGDNQAFKSQLISDLTAPKYASRSGFIEPLHRVSLESNPNFNKREQIEEAIKEQAFRDGLSQALGFSILLQAPLYVGKAKQLKKRLKSHAIGRSDLKRRFSEAGISIETCSLLFIYTDPKREALEADHDTSDTEDEISIEDDANAKLFEEIFSRLFSPLFTLRYG